MATRELDSGAAVFVPDQIGNPAVPDGHQRHPAGGAWGGPFNTYIMGTGGIGDRREEGSYGVNCWLYNARPGQTTIQQRPVEWNWKTFDVKGGNRIPVFADTMWREVGHSIRMAVVSRIASVLLNITASG